MAWTSFLLGGLSRVALSCDDFNVVLARGIELRSAHEGLVLHMVGHGRRSVGCVECGARHEVLLTHFSGRTKAWLLSLTHITNLDHVGRNIGYRASVRHETRLLLWMLGRVRLWNAERKARQRLRRLEALSVVARDGARSLSVLIEVDVHILDNAVDVYVMYVAVLSLLLTVICGHGCATVIVVAIALEGVRRLMHRLLLRVQTARVREARLLARAKLHAWLAEYLSILQFVLDNELVDILRTVGRYDNIGTSHERLVAVCRSRGTTDSAHLLLDHFPLGTKLVADVTFKEAPLVHLLLRK